MFKTVNVRNPRNVLVQIPSAIVAQWGLQEGDQLGVECNDKEVTIRPQFRGRERTTKSCDKVVRATRKGQGKSPKNL